MYILSMHPNVSRSKLLSFLQFQHIIMRHCSRAGSAPEKLRSDSTSSLNISDLSLKRLLKDLQRCDVSLSRYQDMLLEVCILESVGWYIYDFKFVRYFDAVMVKQCYF